MKKSISIVVLMTVILMLSISGASATMTSTADITLGDDATDAANPNGDDGDGEDAPVSGTITLTSSGAGDITNLVCTVSPASGYRNIHSMDEDDFEDDLNMNLTLALTTIASGTTVDVTIDARIPAMLDAVDEEGIESSFKTATITCSGTENGTTATTTSDVYMQRENKLDLVKVYLTSKENDEDSLSDGDKAKDLKPGEEIQVEIKAENDYANNDEVDIESIEAYLVIDDEDMDVEESDDLNNLDPGDDDFVTVKFDIEDDVSAADYAGLVYVLGEDEFGARHGEKYSLEFEVKRESYEIDIEKLELSQDTVDNCVDKTVTLDVKIKNIGKNNDDEIVVKVNNDQLQYSEKIEDIDLDTSDDTTKQFKIPVTTETAAGEYFMAVNTFYRDDDASNSADVILTVTACQTEPDEDDGTDDGDSVDVNLIAGDNDTDATDGLIIAGETPPSTIEGSGFGGSKLYVVILIVAVVVILALLALTIVLLAKTRKAE